jgi:hypothetical protein
MQFYFVTSLQACSVIDMLLGCLGRLSCDCKMGEPTPSLCGGVIRHCPVNARA